MNKSIQLFLLPFAGGSATVYKKLIDGFSSLIEPIVVEYSGRGIRNHEPFITNYDLFLEDVYHSFMRSRNREIPFAILGYSLGSAIAFDLVTQYINEEPEHVFMCARGNLQSDCETKRYSILSEGEFVDKITQLGGIDKRIIENKRFRDIFLKPLKADYQIWSQYKYNNKTIESDLTIMYSHYDQTCENINGWCNLTLGSIDFYDLGTNHFFINDNYKEMADIINQKLCGTKI